MSELKTLFCHNCKDEIREGDHVLIDVNHCVYCSDKCLFLDYGQDQVWKKYNQRTDKTTNFIDLGLMDILYSGNYDKGCLEYIKEVA